ncbi:Probable RNA-directed DNA polymerase from transposon BS [Eumeta japonica]|uniref:Probable RNA-directed DNA polymerase from transposon BS n=1 Tax=Eumeta variegata TaxID=151549 RepID=A0A4C2A4V4_EUMVA|nr:Probable RNA-directed DNA polymerase from transposon BS [Eumeta japonica]
MTSATGCTHPPPAGRHKPNNLTLLSFNARGLTNNIVELGQCTKEYGIDIVLVQETLLKPNSPKSCSLAGYVQLRTDRTDAPLGGTAIYYKRSLQCCPIDLPNLTNIEATGCRLAMTGHKPLVIVSIYLSPSKKLLRSDIEALLALGDAVILFGDFNCKHTNWGCAVSNPGGNKLAKLSRKLKFDIVAPLTPTHYPDDLVSRPSTIDLAITKEVALNVGCIEPIHRLDSDHRPVLLRLGPPTGGCPKPMIKITDWKRVSTALEEIDTPALNNIPDVIETTDEIDSSIGALTNHIRTVVKKCSREVPESIDRRKLPADALELLRAKNAALRLAYAYPSRENRSKARALQRRARARMFEVKNEEWSNLMEDISPTHQAFWKVTKALKSEGYLPTPPLKKPDSSLAVDDLEKAECIADSIELQCSHTLPPHDIQHITHIEEEVRHKTSLDPADDLAPVSRDEVQKLVKDLKAKKAPGLDGISNKAIKCFPTTLLSLLVVIFNACLKNCYFPPVWKEAEVIGIPKPGKPRDLPASYRPISLLSDRITLAQALRLVEYITEGLKQRKDRSGLFDVAKAFDRVWHAGLIHKLYLLKVPDRLILIIHNYLTDRHFVFKHENTHSSRRMIRAGVPQGSALSPLLYSVYTNDIPRSSSGVQLALFADDTALYLRGQTERSIYPLLQMAIEELARWFQTWRIEVNAEKSAAISFIYRKGRSPEVVARGTPPLRINNTPIPWQHTYKYLGITLDRNLHFRDHIKRVRKTAIFYQSRLKGMLGRNSKLSLRNKRTLYLMCIRTVLTYASPVFAHAAPNRLKTASPAE